MRSMKNLTQIRKMQICIGGNNIQKNFFSLSYVCCNRIDGALLFLCCCRPPQFIENYVRMYPWYDIYVTSEDEKMKKKRKYEKKKETMHQLR